jgi:hypothetical protein
MVVEKKKSDEKSLEHEDKEGWPSGLRRQTVNLLRYLIVGSNPAPFIFKF